MTASRIGFDVLASSPMGGDGGKNLDPTGELPWLDLSADEVLLDGCDELTVRK